MSRVQKEIAALWGLAASGARQAARGLWGREERQALSEQEARRACAATQALKETPALWVCREYREIPALWALKGIAAPRGRREIPGRRGRQAPKVTEARRANAGR